MLRDKREHIIWNESTRNSNHGSAIKSYVDLDKQVHSSKPVFIICKMEPHWPMEGIIRIGYGNAFISGRQATNAIFPWFYFSYIMLLLQILIYSLRFGMPIK